MLLGKASVVFFRRGLLASPAAVLQLDAEQLPQQGGASRLGRRAEELLDAWRASLEPGVLEAVADLIDLPGQRQGELFADGLVQGRTSTGSGAADE